MPDPVPAKTDQAPPLPEPAKSAETPKPADAPPPKPADAPPSKPGDQPPPKTEQKPPEQTPEQKAAAEKEQARTRGPDGKFVAEPLIPADWKPKLPEGQKLDETLLGSFRAIMADPKLSHADRAQALVELRAQERENETRAYTETIQRQRYADLETLKGDPEFGGARFDQTRAQARSILEKTKHGPAVSKKFEAVGYDCDPDITKFLAEVRSFIAEDSTSSRLTNPAPENGTKPMSQIDRQAATYRNQPRK